MSGPVDLLAGLVVDDRGTRWGSRATRWQYDDAAAVLEPRDGDPRQNFLLRPKGGAKTEDVAGYGVVWLIDQAADLDAGYVFAADQDQATRLLDRVRGFVRRTDGLDLALRVEATSVLNVRTGARLHALPADVAGNEGILSAFLICEELPNWAETPTARGQWSVVVSTVPKTPGCRLVCIGHASDPSHFSAAILDHARRSPAWRVSEVPGPLPWATEESLAEQRALLLPSEYARRHLNLWSAAEDRLAARDDVVACVGHDGDLEARPGVRYVASLDVGLTNDRTVAVVAHAEGRGADVVVVVDRLAVWQGSRSAPVDLDAVRAWLEQACRAYRSPLTFDPFQAALLTQQLKASGVTVRPFTFSTSAIGRLAATLFRLVRDHRLDLPDDADLVDEFATVRLREVSPGVHRIDHDASRHDDRVIAVAMAAAALVERAGGGHGHTSSPVRSSIGLAGRSLDAAVDPSPRRRRYGRPPRSVAKATRLDGTERIVAVPPGYVPGRPQ